MAENGRGKVHSYALLQGLKIKSKGGDLNDEKMVDRTYNAVRVRDIDHVRFLFHGLYLIGAARASDPVYAVHLLCHGRRRIGSVDL